MFAEYYSYYTHTHQNIDSVYPNMNYSDEDFGRVGSKKNVAYNGDSSVFNGYGKPVQESYEERKQRAQNKNYDIFNKIETVTSSVRCEDKHKLIIFHENKQEKIFFFEGKVYKVLKGNDRQESILFILDRNQFTKIDYFNSY
jgi:hypothetical protein